MNEAQLRQQFIQFLHEKKGYPSDSILVEAPIIRHKNLGTLRADLLIVDTRIGEYIALIEFKSPLRHPNAKKSARMQILNYLKFLKAPTLPAYLVTPPIEGETGFNIMVASEGTDWKSISGDQFPEFETLSSKKIIEEGKKIEEEEKIIEETVESRRRLKYIRALVPIFGVTLGLTAAIYSSFLITNGEGITVDNCDCEVIIAEIDSLKTQMNVLKTVNKSSSHSDTTYVVDSTNTYNGLSNRIKTIEDGISETPERALATLNLSKEIEKLDERILHSRALVNQMKEDQKDRIALNRSFIIGIIITIVTIAIGVLLTYYYEKHKNTDNNT
ncbi:MAG: hypothetical protein ACJARP_002139 [Vicingaceae bacterium]|jgi:hypothetical protein